MEVEVKEALHALTQENTQMDAHQVLGLQDRLRIVDEKFSLMRSEVSRLNAMLAEEKEKNNVLKGVVDTLTNENAELKSRPVPKAAAKAAPKKTSKKKTTKKKK